MRVREWNGMQVELEKGVHFGGMGGGCWLQVLRVGGVVTCGHPPIPAAVAFLLLDAGVVPRLVARVAEVGQHVRPQALVL